MKKDTKFLNKVIGLLSIIAVLLLVGVLTTPKILIGLGYNESEGYSANNNERIYYTVTYNSNGGTPVTSEKVEYGDYVSKPNDPTMVCYKFNGWYLNGERYYFHTKVENDLLLEAKWIYNPDCDNKYIYIVNFDYNDGENYGRSYVIDGEKAEYIDVTRDGYTFDGWYLNNKKYNFNNPVKNSINLVAHYTKKDNKVYTINFNSNGGTRVERQRVYSGDLGYYPDTPFKDGYIFNGWYLNGEEYYFDTPVTSNIYLDARWVKEKNYENTYTVTFNSNGGSYVSKQYITEGGLAYVPEEPIKNGYTFMGWYKDDEYYNFSKPIYDNIILVAHYQKDETKYAEYCKKEKRTYYSTSYVGHNTTALNYSWTIRFDTINASEVNIKSIDYLSSNDYQKSYINSYNKEISMKNSNGGKGVNVTSGSMLKLYSLKSNNFFKDLSTPYLENGYWYTDATVWLKDFYGTTPYYADNIASYINFVPFKFEIEYVDLNNCEDDLYSKRNNYKYKDYKIVDTYYR